ncbi:hypothetical protein [Mucilaginibacter sp.]|jgi:hypothetical protein|uniref:hypothetical protein n=1 Tax=Mucilaginibacter sp. TaxID=1882438 RepID=UPI003568C6B1
MVILKVNSGTDAEREVEIVTERGLWESGIYKIFNARFLTKSAREPVEPGDKNDPNFLGEINVNKENARWEYRGKLLLPDEQKEVAEFILDYQAPDSVY